MSKQRKDPVWTPGQVLETPIGSVILEKQLGAGKSGYSHLATLDGRQIVAKRMHDEPVPYYEFHDDKCALEYRAYVRLKRIGVPVPTMLHLNPEGAFIIKEYVPGPDGLHAIRDGLIDDEVIRELRLLSDLCRKEGINLDWFPANFAILEPENDLSFGEVGAGKRLTKRLAYIDYELNEYSEEWSFENWGIWYWANTHGVSLFLETGDSSAINDPPDSGHPIRENSELVHRLLSES